MRLRTAIPLIPQHVLDTLDACGVKTVETFLLDNTPEDIVRQAPPNMATYEELLDIREQLIRISAADGLRGDQWVDQPEEATEQSSGWTTGMTELDKLFHTAAGGSIIEISGGKGSGKSALALHCALSYLHGHDDSSPCLVHWMDITGGFSAQRAFTSAELLMGKRTDDRSIDKSSIVSVLDRLQISLAFDIATAQCTLDSLIANLRVQTQAPRLRMLVVDSITPLMAPLLSAVSSEGHAVMTEFMLQLKRLTREFGIIVLVINNSVLRRPDDVDSASIFPLSRLKPALGPTFTHLTDATLCMARGHDILDFNREDKQELKSLADVFVVEVLRSWVSDPHVWWTFRIQNGCLCPSDSPHMV